MKSFLDKIRLWKNKSKDQAVVLIKKYKIDKFIRRLDWYIIKKFLGTYFFAIALIISIAVVDELINVFIGVKNNGYTDNQGYSKEVSA